MCAVPLTALGTETQQRKLCAAPRAPKLGRRDEQPNKQFQYNKWGYYGHEVQIVTMLESRRASWRKGCFTTEALKDREGVSRRRRLFQAEETAFAGLR